MEKEMTAREDLDLIKRQRESGLLFPDSELEDVIDFLICYAEKAREIAVDREIGIGDLDRSESERVVDAEIEEAMKREGE